MDRQTDRQTDTHKPPQTDRQTDGHTQTPSDRQTDRQTDRRAQHSRAVLMAAQRAVYTGASTFFSPLSLCLLSLSFLSCLLSFSSLYLSLFLFLSLFPSLFLSLRSLLFSVGAERDL